MEQTISSPKQPTVNRNLFFLVGVILVLGLIAVMAANLNKVQSVDLQGRQAPDFKLTLFDQFEQDQLHLVNMRGQVIVVNFWASWCVECYKEASLLEQAWQDYKDRGVVFVGVDYLDIDKEGLAYMQKYGITYPSGPDLGSKISKDYAITGVPETFFINRDGHIVHVQIGPIDQEQLYRLLEQLVTRPAQGS